MKIPVAILGPTSYTALHLIQLLRRHPAAELTYLASQRDELPNIAEEFPQLMGLCELQCQKIDPPAIADQAEVIFTCVPHLTAMEYVPRLLEAGLRVIDLSADYRLADPALYEKVYQHPHTDTENLADAVYGLPELFGDEIPEADLVANPGCYATAAALAIAPLLARNLVKPTGIIVNAASGITGAGRRPAPHLHFPEMNEAFTAYNVGTHRHQPEIEQTLAAATGQEAQILFVPHLLPLNQGILESIYLDPASEAISEEDLFDAFEDAYADEPFIRIRNDLPNLKHVRDSNFCDLSVRLVKGKAVVFAALDNMIKGASGQALQNMNLMFKQEATLGLL
ncbi:MAG: N-acetyl-gamma-glutamyl-phosphate reductase [Phycisphaeraceae bacterium]|nr:N-acetyl-gamma-glutamyl-phosphate reductase [Phycisphaeraceae bacterium]